MRGVLYAGATDRGASNQRGALTNSGGSKRYRGKRACGVCTARLYGLVRCGVLTHGLYVAWHSQCDGRPRTRSALIVRVRARVRVWPLGVKAGSHGGHGDQVHR